MWFKASKVGFTGYVYYANLFFWIKNNSNELFFPYQFSLFSYWNSLYEGINSLTDFYSRKFYFILLEIKNEIIKTMSILRLACMKHFF